MKQIPGMLFNTKEKHPRDPFKSSGYPKEDDHQKEGQGGVKDCAVISEWGGDRRKRP